MLSSHRTVRHSRTYLTVWNDTACVSSYCFEMIAAVMQNKIRSFISTWDCRIFLCFHCQCFFKITLKCCWRVAIQVKGIDFQTMTGILTSHMSGQFYC